MKISLFVGDITEAPVDAICTSTNPRLSLMMGTGGSVRERGGFEVLRAAEAIVQQEFERSGRHILPVGAAYSTTAGTLPFKIIIHCIASDSTHLSSPEVVKRCVKNALLRAEEAGCKTVGMPPFATGHAHLRFDRSLQAIVESLQDATSSVEEVVIVVSDRDRASRAIQAFKDLINETEVVIR